MARQKLLSFFESLDAKIGLLVALVLTGCTEHKKIAAKRGDVVIFKNVVDGRCEIDHVQLDAKSGNQVVICKAQ